MSDIGWNILGGIIAAFTGFLFAFAWDCYKTYKSNKANKNLSLKLLVNEVTKNKDRALANINYCESENSNLDHDNELRFPMLPLKTGGWKHVELNNISDTLDFDTIENVRDTYDVIEFVNQLISLRQSFKLHSAGTEKTDNFKASIKYKNKYIIKYSHQIHKTLSTELENLKEVQKKVN